MTTHDNSFGAIIALKKALPEAMVISWDPDRLLGIVRLEHVLTLHLQGDEEIRSWIWIRLSGLSKLDVARHVVGTTVSFVFDVERAWKQRQKVSDYI